ncbi:hydrolase [Croceibacterium mercuriale]|uniref:Hydrolase n=1 Tax=Croceibacterium mercuriale TaxID=1572751 RepID=A0A0B2BWJ3_9SPHN|nr:alpha/beta fold hydrolase [Croceibacterium mercuriale]KHL25754.1 hydrolase [Croceibacterium mercuriale]
MLEDEIVSLRTQMVEGHAGTRLAVHRLGPEDGGGRPVLLLHGLFSNAHTNWIKFGHAQKLADAGFEAIMPDLRAHGQSEAPTDAAAYPAGVLLRDVTLLVQALQLDDFDLVGFSLGARTSAGAVIAGLRPRRLVLAGMGLSGLTGWDRRADFFIDAIDRFDDVVRGDPAWLAVQFMRTMGVNRAAARLLLGSVGDIEPAELAAIAAPTLVVCGSEDRDNGSPEELVAALPDGREAEVPGTHMSSVTFAALGQAIVDFLAR